MGAWHLASSAVQGEGHKASETPCQDATAFFSSRAFSIICLADGAGSATLSHIGAQTAVDASVELFRARFNELFDLPEDEAKAEILYSILKPLSSEAETQECSIKDLACTLLVVAVKQGRVIAFHVGDGVIGALRNMELKVLTLPDNGEHPNETTFITSRDALLRARLLREKADKYSGFVVMSDGTEQSLYDKRARKLAPAITKLFFVCKNESQETMEALLKEMLEKQISQRTADDCSIALMARDRSKLNRLYNSKYGPKS